MEKLDTKVVYDLQGISEQQATELVNYLQEIESSWSKAHIRSVQNFPYLRYYNLGWGLSTSSGTASRLILPVSVLFESKKFEVKIEEGFKFIHEVERTYIFPTKTVNIKGPTKIKVSGNGHRIVTADGTSHYIPSGWVHLYWTPKEGYPNFEI